MCACQVSGLFETRRVFVERSCNGGVDRNKLGVGIAAPSQTRSDGILERFSGCWPIPPSGHSQRSTWNQSLRDPAVRNTTDVRRFRLEAMSVHSCLDLTSI